MATLSLTNPVVGGSEDTWGTTLNTNFTNISNFIGSLDSAELAVLDGITATTAELNKLDGVTATTAELNFVDGVTSNIQTQLDAKQPLDTQLTALASVAAASNRIPYFTGSSTASYFTFYDQDTMSSNSATGIPSQQSVKAYVDAVDAKLIGDGQSYTEVAYVVGTSYQNTTGRPITVMWRGDNSTFGKAQISSDNVTWIDAGGVGASNQRQVTLIVPPNYYYRQNGGNVDPNGLLVLS